MHYMYDVRHGLYRVKTKSQKALGRFVSLTAVTVALAAFVFAPANAATSTVVYNNIPNPTPGNLPSEAFEATGTSEFGGQVQLAGSARTNAKVTVLMSSWGCQDGHWYSGDCITSPGSTFSVPITLNVYTVEAGNHPGADPIATLTKTFDIPYRPSADLARCTGDNAGKWFKSGVCYNGYATPISFDLTGTLPDKAIVSVAYNTTHYGYHPMGESQSCYTSGGGCGYDSLNVALNDEDSAPSVGSTPVSSDAYIRTLYDSCAHGSISPFDIDTGCWTGYQPAIKIEATTLPSSVDQCKKDGWKAYSMFKNQGDCVSYVASKGKNQPSGQ